MTKFFRRYGQTTLMYVMAALLVIWLLEGVMMRGGGRGGGPMSDEVVGTAFGAPIRQGQLRRATSDLEITATLMPMVDPSTGRRMPPVIAAHGSDAQKNEVATALLLEEAQRLGFRTSREEIRKRLASTPNIGEAINHLMATQQTTEEAIIDAIARVLSLAKLEDLNRGMLSLPEIEKEYVDHNERMDARVSAIDVEPFLAQAPEPTDAELEALFNEGKDRQDGHTEGALRFGYQVPDKVVVQYVTVDPSPLIENIRVSEREARPFYEANLKSFMKRSEGPQLDPSRPAMVQMTFEEAESQVKDRVRETKASDEAAGIINGIIDELNAPWDAIAPDAEGKRAAPAPDKIVSLKDLAAKYSRGGSTVIYHETPPLDLAALRLEPGFGRAMLMTPQNRSVAAADMAFDVAGLPEPENLKAFGASPLRINEPSPICMSQVFGTQARQPYVFRVVKVQPKGPPASWTDVRDKLVKDFKLKRAFELAGAQAQKLADAARAEGLDAAVAHSEVRGLLQAAEIAASTQPAEASAAPKTYLTDLTPVDANNITRQGVSAPNIGHSTELGKALFAATTQPTSRSASQAATTAASRHVVVQPMATAKKWVVAEVVKVKPLYQEDFAKLVPMYRQFLNSSQAQRRLTEGDKRILDWSDTENVFKRAGYVPAKTE